MAMNNAQAAPNSGDMSTPSTDRVLISADEIQRWVTGPLIQIVVGQESAAQTFGIHRDLVTSRSKFFKIALSGAWLESEEQAVKLPEDDPAAFMLYLHLLCLNTVPIKYTIDTVTNEHAMSEAGGRKKPNLSTEDIALYWDCTRQEYLSIVTLYVFCDKLQDTKSKNMLITAMVETSSRRQTGDVGLYPDLNIIYDLYMRTTPGDPMRKLVVDFFVENGTTEWVDELKASHEMPQSACDFAHEFLSDLASGLFQKCDLPARLIVASNYHESLVNPETNGNPGTQEANNGGGN